MKTDIAILGGGISGLVCAAYLEKAGKDYLLFEALDQVGGFARGQLEQGVWLDYGLKSIPVGNLSQNPLLKLKEDLGLNINIETVLAEPLQFQPKTGFIPFVGFGDNIKNRSLLSELSYYTQSPRVLVANGWKSLVDELLRIIPQKKIKTNSHVTKIILQDNGHSHSTINGEHSVHAETTVFALPISLLDKLMDPKQVPSKFLTKLGRNSFYTAISFDLATKKRFSDLSNILLFTDDAPLTLGQFTSNCDPMKQTQGLQLSTWMTLLEAEDALDDETVSKTIKAMKKQIKKSFPELLEAVTWERLLVARESHGTSLDIPEISKNFWILGAQTKDNSKNLEASILSSQKFAQSLL